MNNNNNNGLENVSSQNKIDIKYQIASLIIGCFLLTFYVVNRIEPIHVNSIIGIAKGRIVTIIIYLSLFRILSVFLCFKNAKSKNRKIWPWIIFGFVLPPIALIVLPLINDESKNYKVKRPIIILLITSLTTIVLYFLIPNIFNDATNIRETTSVTKYKKVEYKNISFDIPLQWIASFDETPPFIQIFCNDDMNENYFLILWAEGNYDKYNILNTMYETYKEQEMFKNMEFRLNLTDHIYGQNAASYNVEGTYLGTNQKGKLTAFEHSNKIYFISYMANEQDYEKINFHRIISSLNLQNIETTGSNTFSENNQLPNGYKLFNNNDLSLVYPEKWDIKNTIKDDNSGYTLKFEYGKKSFGFTIKMIKSTLSPSDLMNVSIDILKTNIKDITFSQTKSTNSFDQKGLESIYKIKGEDFTFIGKIMVFNVEDNTVYIERWCESKNKDDLKELIKLEKSIKFLNLENIQK